MGNAVQTAGYSIASVLLLVVAAICSGLNLGLLGIDDLRLETLQVSTGSKEEKHAKRILPLLRDRHLVLVTLLLFNAMCMELLPILLEILVGHLAALAISITGVLLFGEIVPQSIFHRYSIPISAALAPLVWVMIFLTFSISFPLARLLDLISGKPKEILFRREELRNLLDLYDERNKVRKHGKSGADATNHESSPHLPMRKLRSTKNMHHTKEGPEPSQDTLVDSISVGVLSGVHKRSRGRTITEPHESNSNDFKDGRERAESIVQDPTDYELLPYEINVMKAALRTGTKHMKTNIVPLCDVYALSADMELNKTLLKEIIERGHSRIPVYSGPDKGNIVGLLRTKSLINHDLRANETVADVMCHEIMWFTEDTHLYSALEQFRKGRSHMAAVVQTTPSEKGRFGISSSLPSRAIGIITLEDVIERIIGANITDEAELEAKRSDSSGSSEVSATS